MQSHGEDLLQPEWKARGKEWLTNLIQAMRFYSRLPVPALPWDDALHAVPDFRALSRAVPFAGLAIGLLPALVLLVALLLNLGPWVSATLCIAALTATTGALHEDGLADTADGFGAGSSREQRLAIMRDSHVGAFGASALFLTFFLRIAALATLAGRAGPLGLAVAILIAASLSRTAGLIVLTQLPPARLEGLSYAVGRPRRVDLRAAWLAAIAIALILGFLASLPLVGIALMILLAISVAVAVTRLSDRLIQGQTGDVAGAIQQVAEVAALIGLLSVVPP